MTNKWTALAALAAMLSTHSAAAQTGEPTPTGPSLTDLSGDLNANFQIGALAEKCAILNDVGTLALRLSRANIMSLIEVNHGERAAKNAYVDAIDEARKAKTQFDCSDASKAGLAQDIESEVITLVARAYMALQADNSVAWAKDMVRSRGHQQLVQSLAQNYLAGPRKADLEAAANRAGTEVEMVLAILCPQRPKFADGKARPCPTIDEAALVQQGLSNVKLPKFLSFAQVWLTGAEMFPAFIADIRAGKAPSITYPIGDYARYVRNYHHFSQEWEGAGVAPCELGDPVIAIAPATNMNQLNGQTRALVRFGDGAPIGTVTLEWTIMLGDVEAAAADPAATAAGVGSGPKNLFDNRGTFIRCG